MFAEFDASVLDIVGLTNYVPGSLPQWLRERLDDLFFSPDGRSMDDELVQRFVLENGKGRWLGGWGCATISDKDVYMFEYRNRHDFAFFEPAESAELFGCGLVFVEPSDRFDVGSTLFFTEHRQCVQRTGQCVGTLTQGGSWSAATTAAVGDLNSARRTVSERCSSRL